MLGDAEVTRYYERTFTRADAEAWLGRQLDRYARAGHGLWLVIDRESDNPVGQVGLAMQEVEGTSHPEIGWLLHRPFWGKGYATEAAMAARDAAFEYWKDDRWLVGRLVEVPGVMSQGENLAELEENIRDAYRLMAETDPPPQGVAVEKRTIEV